MPGMKTFALSYVQHGFRVFPVKLDKTPFTSHGLKDATQTQQGVNEYWDKWLLFPAKVGKEPLTNT